MEWIARSVLQFSFYFMCFLETSLIEKQFSPNSTLITFMFEQLRNCKSNIIEIEI